MARSGDGIYLRGDTWYYETVIDKIRYRRRIGSGIPRKTALDISRKIRVEIISGNYGYGKKQKDVTFDVAREKFEAWAIANKKPNSVRSYKECLRRLSETFGGKRLSQISSFLVEGHRQRRIKAGARVRANRELSVLKKPIQSVQGMGPLRGRKSCREREIDEGTKTARQIFRTRGGGPAPGEVQSALADDGPRGHLLRGAAEE